MFPTLWACISGVTSLLIFSQLAWPFTILQDDNIMISWDFLRLTSPAAMPGYLGAKQRKYVCSYSKQLIWYEDVL